MATWQKTEIAVYNTGETDMVVKGSVTEFTCCVLYSVLLQPKKNTLHAPHMAVNDPWRTSVFYLWYEIMVPLINVLADEAHPMLSVFPTLCRSAQRILKRVFPLLVYFVRWSTRFLDCTGLPPSCMQKASSEEVSTTQNALPPDFEGGLSLFANGTQVTPASVKALAKSFKETTKQTKKVDKQVMKQEAKQDANQVARAGGTLKVAGKRPTHHPSCHV